MADDNEDQTPDAEAFVIAFEAPQGRPGPMPLADALVNLSDVMGQLIEAAQGVRAKAEAAGFSSGISEQVGAQFLMVMMGRFIGGS